tara:strand:- start:3904 stop:4206 length:303 start_codon:yes stop_codon:yes gene_type:complete
MKYIKEKTINIVSNLLMNHPHLRDDDNKLLATVWYHKMDKIEEPVMDFLHVLANGELPSSESIRRCRQKLQELNPQLRGQLWNKRHQMQDQVKKELKEME